MSSKSTFVVSAEWLEEHLQDTDLSIVDGSWYLPTQNRDARAEYEQAHIPGAIFFDHDAVVDPNSDLPHTIPSPEVFANHMSAMGINQNNTIVVYDGPGMFSAARVWWLFHVFGVEKIYILDGGFDSWKSSNRPVTAEPSNIVTSNFTSHYIKGKIVQLNAMAGIVASGKGQIADARSAARFKGEAPEPRENMRSGHMPGAINIPYTELINEGSLKNLDQLKQTLEDAGLDTTKPIVTTCGSGVTASIINLALCSIGRNDSRLYDGSWSEWGARKDTLTVQGN